MPLVPQEPKIGQPVLYLLSGGSTQAEMQPHSSVTARATGKVGRKSWRSFCSGSRYAGSGKQGRSMRAAFYCGVASINSHNHLAAAAAN